MKGNFTLILSILLFYNVAGQSLGGYRQSTVNNSQSRQQAPLAGDCPANIDFEAGSLVNWKCFTGTTSVERNKNAITVTPSTPITGRHTLYAKGAAGDVDPYGLFPVNPPDGSGYAVRLGNNINGSEAERITYEFTVPANANDASFTYRYAVVFQDPGHNPNEQPRFIARMLDVATQTYLPCASNEYIATASLPGFKTSPVDGSVKYKTWSSVFLNLGAYAGKRLQLEFTTADCTRSAHWGYAYVDVGDCNVTASALYECNPNIASFTGPPGFQEYKWYDNNFSTVLGTGETLVLNPAPKINNVNVVVIPFNGFGCSDTLQASIYPILPLANAGPDTLICPGRPVQLGTPEVNGFTYAWTPAINLSDPLIAQPVGTPSAPAAYELTVTSTESGCIDKDTLNITVFQPIAIGVSPDQTICEGQPVNLQATGTAVEYVWSPAQGLNRANIPNPIAIPQQTTTYQVVGLDGHQCFTDTGFVKVLVNPKPKVNVGPDVTQATGTTYTFSPATQNGPVISWQWSPANDLSCTNCSKPVASIKKNMTYYATVTNEFGCEGTDSMHIKTFCLNTQVFIPNAFSPDGDGVNDVLMVRGKGIGQIRSFRIFSRWGELVFEKRNFLPNDPAFGWDGRVRGKVGAPEVYVYTADVICENDLINTYKGNVTLLK